MATKTTQNDVLDVPASSVTQLSKAQLEALAKVTDITIKAAYNHVATDGTVTEIGILEATGKLNAQYLASGTLRIEHVKGSFGPVAGDKTEMGKESK